MVNSKLEHNPTHRSWICAPGHIALEQMHTRGLDKQELSDKLNLTDNDLNRVLSGSSILNASFAAKFSKYLGGSKQFWLNLEKNYRKTRKQMREKLKPHLSTLGDIPYRELMERGYIVEREASSEKEKLNILLDFIVFMEYANIEDWQDAAQPSYFRVGNRCPGNVNAVSSWLRICELEVFSPENDFNLPSFEKTVSHIRSFTRLDPDVFQPKMKDRLNRCGVGYITEPATTNSRISGAVKLVNDRPAIFQSLYGKFADIYWFTFFHECAHIILGHLEEDEIRVDLEGKDRVIDDKEMQADKWAQEILIPKENEIQLRQLRSRPEVIEFSRKISVHPGIVVGRLQHLGIIGHDTLNGLRTRYEFVEARS